MSDIEMFNDAYMKAYRESAEVVSVYNTQVDLGMGPLAACFVAVDLVDIARHFNDCIDDTIQRYALKPRTREQTFYLLLPPGEMPNDGVIKSMLEKYLKYKKGL